MTTTQGRNRIARGVALASLALALTTPVAFPVLAQDTLAEARIRKMEAEIRALQRQVFPGGDGKYFAPEVPQGAAGSATATAQPATTPVTDLLSRMDALEAQVARLTAQVEENGNRLSKIEARLAPQAPASPAPEPSPAAVAPAPAVTPSPAASPAPRPVATASPAPRAVASPAPAASPRPAASATSAPSAQRLAAVRAIVKPQTDDPGDDEYSYGFRLWDAKFYPEAQQQLKLMIDRYPRHARISHARNLLGRAFLDDGKPREAATWFLQNYQADKRGDRAPDSLLYLAESMRRLNDTNRACIALAEFGDSYPSDAAGRLKAQYEQTRSAVKCN
jgi:TolA-binding protein